MTSGGLLLAGRTWSLCVPLSGDPHKERHPVDAECQRCQQAPRAADQPSSPQTPPGDSTSGTMQSCSSVPSSVVGDRPLSLLVRSFLGEEEAQTEECVVTMGFMEERTSQRLRWKGRGEGSGGEQGGWERFAKGGHQRPWKQVKRDVSWGRRRATGGAVGESSPGDTWHPPPHPSIRR